MVGPGDWISMFAGGKSFWKTVSTATHSITTRATPTLLLFRSEGALNGRCDNHVSHWGSTNGPFVWCMVAMTHRRMMTPPLSCGDDDP